MTLKEAKKILEKEGFKLGGPGKPGVVSEAFAEYEAPDICEAMQIVCSAGFQLAMLAGVFDERKERLKKEYEKNTKAPDSAKNCIKEDSVVINPALKESASQFNDALLDELRKKIAAYKKLHFYDTKTSKRKDEIIEELRDKNAELLGMVERMKEDVKDIDTNLNAANKTNKDLNKKVVELTKIKGDLNSWISGLYFCIHHNNDNYKYKLKCLGKEIAKLNGIIHDKNAILSDVAEELRLTKIREKNLTELCKKYIKANEELKKKLANNVVDKIDAQALKSAESTLAYKEKVIAEKDEVIADLTHELKAKHKKYVWYKCAYDAAQQILNTIADYAAKHPDKKFSDQMVEDNHPIEGDPVRNSGENEMEEHVKRLCKARKKCHRYRVSCDNAEEGADLSGVIVLCGKDFIDALKKVKDVWQE